MSDVFLAACDDYAKAETAVKRILEHFGGAEKIMGGAKNILVKPNLIMPRNPDAASTTHPNVVAAVCGAFRSAGANVTIIDSTGMPHTAVTLKGLYSKCGMEQAAEASGAVLSYDTSQKQVELPGGVSIKSASLLTPIVEADMVISLGKAKTHALGMYTGTVKNMFGAVAGMGKPALHAKFPNPDDFFNMILDVFCMAKVSFAILDGIVGMEGDGPTGGTPKKLGVVLGGFDAHAVDYTACRLMGFHTERIPSLRLAEKRELFSSESVALHGDDSESLKTFFRPPNPHKTNGSTSFVGLLTGKLGSKRRAKAAPFPVIASNCVGCGDCANICPQKTIEIKDKKAVIKKSDCIKCYCCHEFCPVKAIGFEK